MGTLRQLQGYFKNILLSPFKSKTLSVKVFAKLSLNSIQSQFKLSLRLALFPAAQPTYPATKPPTHPGQKCLGLVSECF